LNIKNQLYLTSFTSKRWFFCTSCITLVSSLTHVSRQPQVTQI